MWNNPDEDAEKRRLTRSLNKETQGMKTFESMEIPENLTEALMEAENEDNKENRENRQIDMSQTCFSFSNFRDEVREKYMDFVKSKGAK